MTSDPIPAPSDSAEPVSASLSADISEQWSWASSSARIPQISSLAVTASDALEDAKVNISLRDGDETFGSTEVKVAIAVGTTDIGSVHVPLSARAMSRVDERRAVECVVELEDVATGRIHARVIRAVDLHPRDLWYWDGDPRRAEGGAREFDSTRGSALARSLLASFVRPNHPEVAVLAREASSARGRTTGEPAFSAFQQVDSALAEAAVEASISAIYDVLQARDIGYSEPPPGIDFFDSGQRIRDHGDVARGGLGTCMDTTVLTAAVIEHVGLYPVLVLVPGHIFVGYWRRDPDPAAGTPEWYPAKPVFTDSTRIIELVSGGWLGLLETTVFTTGNAVTAIEARTAPIGALQDGLSEDRAALIDVLAARKAGVSPLPAVNERPDGVTEVIEYRAGGPAQRTEVAPATDARPSGPRFVDTHPPRYRTWKSSLFSLNATNALLNLGNGPAVQPIALPPEGLGVLEDKLNQDVEFSLLSGFDLPELYRARDIPNAVLMEPSDQIAHMNDRQLFIQRIGTARSAAGPIPPAKFVAEIRAMARRAKEARDERGMNPLFLCIGMLRWSHKPGAFAESPLILVPVRITARRGRAEFALALDTSAHTTPNAALIEWLRREHDLAIPELSEPAADHAGIDVDGVLLAVRRAVAQRGLPFDVVSEAKLALLDLSAFRMWQDLHENGDAFLERPLIRHLVHSPAEQFVDPVVTTTGGALAEDGVTTELEKLETPIPADATQKTAVLWAREGRSFVLQGPPGTGKSQTITNMVAECVLSGMRVLFVAEKGTALAVVARRLDAIGLAPFSLNLHHEGSNAAEVRAQLKRSQSARAAADVVAVETAQRRLRNSRFELGQYPLRLHRNNAAGLSAYSAHDRLLALGDGPTMSIPNELVASRADLVRELAELFAGVQPVAAAAGVRAEHPWRLVGTPHSTRSDVSIISDAIRGVLAGVAWSESVHGPLREVLDEIVHPAQLRTLSVAAEPRLPHGADLANVLEPAWPHTAESALLECERVVREWAGKLEGYHPDVLRLDLKKILSDLDDAASSGLFGRSKRQLAAIEPLRRFAPPETELSPDAASGTVRDLIAAQSAQQWIADTLSKIHGVAPRAWVNAFAPRALEPMRRRFEELVSATSALRESSPWSEHIRALAVEGAFASHTAQLQAYADAWQTLWDEAGATDRDLETWRGTRSLADVTREHAETWRRQVDHERLLPLQRWSELIGYLRPLTDAGLGHVRSDLLEGRLRADSAEDAFTRGLAHACERERVATEGLDHFDSSAHDQRVIAYATAEAEVRRQWVTSGPAGLLDTRGGGRSGARTGGLARELEKTRNRLGTRAIMRKFGNAVQELTPLVLCSPSSAVDLIEPGVIDFDVVIFDEASQITVPEAVGAMGRARAVVVVGDSRQMPPTRKIGAQTASDTDVEDLDIEEIVEDQESILSECELARVPTLQLSWHYRSQDEALIAFSNGAYYGGDLSSFPTPTLLSTETGVELRRVDGHFIRSSSSDTRTLASGVVAGKATNSEEALAIVAAVRDLLASPRKPTIGIVTFNEQQRQLIDELLRSADAPAINAAMDESSMGPSDVLFVKALEQVQGDERDVVLFSIAFSKQANGKIPLNFGPLSNLGGERRLNVAVTRARRKNIVFCSFDPDELDAESAAYRGVKDLKKFLIFARAAGRGGEVAAPLGRAVVRDRHRDDIAAALRATGLHVMTDVGLSDFRLDLVIARNEAPERVLLPVLLDGESWRTRRTVSDRDVLAVVVLRDLMGWPAVARIWWPMWLQNRQEVIDQILGEVDRAEEALTTVVEPSPAPDSEPSTVPLAEGDSPAADAPQLDRQVASSATLGRLPVPPVSEAYEPSTIESKMSPLIPAPAVVDQPQTTQSGSQDNRFRAAHLDVVGAREVLDALPNRTAAAAVREQLTDVIEFEGPVEVGRLVRIVARRFGLSAVRAARADDIARVIPARQVRKSKGEVFAWPADVDPATWSGYRTFNPDAPRALDEIAIEEIANAMSAIVLDRPGVSADEVIRRTAELFGIGRLGSSVRSRLEMAHKRMLSRPAPSPDGSAAPATVPSTADVSADSASLALPPNEPVRAPTVATLVKGANVVVADCAPASPARLLVGIGWEVSASDAESIALDGSAIVLGPDGRVVDDDHFVFFNNRATSDGAVVHRGDTSSTTSDREQIGIDLAMLGAQISRIVFVVSVDGAAREAGPSFRSLGSAHIRVLDENDEIELTRFDLVMSHLGNETAMVFGELYRRGTKWKFRAVGQGYESGLRGIAIDFGVDVE